MVEREDPEEITIIRRAASTAPLTSDRALTEPVDDRTKIRTLVYSVMEQVDLEAQGNYIGLVDPLVRPDVLRMSSEHYPHYADQFGTKVEFGEAFARNWVAKHRAFGFIADARGFSQVESTTSKSEYNDSVIGCLTRSSSYLFLGPHSLEEEGEGSMLSYARIPFRHDPRMSDIFVSKGARITNLPTLWQGLGVIYPHGGVTEGFTTSPLLSIVRSSDTENPLKTIQGFVDTVRFGSDVINATLLAYPTRNPGVTARDIH